MIIRVRTLTRKFTSSDDVADKKKKKKEQV